MTPAKKWIEALRSGGYRQGIGRLHSYTEGTYCCLGVACEVALSNGVIEDYDGSEPVLPVEVRDWLGLSCEDGSYYERNLIDHNDNDGWTFNQIADLIESEPEGMFREA